MKMKIEEEKERKEGQLLDNICMQPRVELRRAELSEKYIIWQEPKLPGMKGEEPEPPGGKVDKTLQHPNIKKEGDFTELPVTGVHVLTEDKECQHEENKGAEPLRSRSSQHTKREVDGEHDGGPQADNWLAPMSDCVITTPHASHTDDEEWQSDDEAEEWQDEMRRHTGSKRWECSDDEDEEWQDELRRHTGSKRWECSQCGKMFGSEFAFKTHMMGHTDEETAPRPKKRARLGTDVTETANDGTVWREEHLGMRLNFTPIEAYGENGEPTAAVGSISSRLESFLRFVTLDMLRIIQASTIQHAQQTEDVDWFVSLSELMAFIAIVILRGVIRVPSLNDCWSANLGNPQIIRIMSRNRFQDLMQHLRFDDKSTRSERVKTDRFAAISDVWGSFVTNCITSYNPGRHITVDQQLLPSKTRCSFLQYVASKPDKLGIKFWVACDLETKYVCNVLPCLGKDPGGPSEERLSENVVMQLMEPFLDKGRNVTTDKIFTSLSLAKRLLGRKTTILGALGKIGREIPLSAKRVDCDELSTRVFSTIGATLTVYAPKRKKAVYVLSSMHDSVQTDNAAREKPNTVALYNTARCGVDVMDQMLREYTVRAGTRRWPIAVFYNMVDMAALNAYVLYRACAGKHERRVDFLVELARELAHSHVDAKKAQREQMLQKQNCAPGKRALCQVKHQCKHNHATMRCVDCYRYTCGKCRREMPWQCGDCE